MSPVDAPSVLQALIDLNRLEEQIRALGPRSVRKPELEKLAARERPKIPPFILAHHDRIRARGRASTVPVRDWVCRGCFLSVPIGLRTKLANHDDICVCENCGSYIYVPTPEQQQAQEAAEAKKREAALRSTTPGAKTPAPSPAARKSGVKQRPRAAVKKRPAPAARTPRKASKPAAKASPRRTASRSR